MKKTRGLLTFGLGVLVGMMLAPQKGEDFRAMLKEKIDDIYLQAKEINIDSIKDKLEDLRFEASKLDANTSKEFIAKQSKVIKKKLVKLVDDLQNNEHIKPTVEKAVDSTKDALDSAINYIDENQIVEKAKEKTTHAISKSKKTAGKLKDKSSDLYEEATSKAKAHKSTRKHKKVDKDGFAVLDDDE